MQELVNLLSRERVLVERLLYRVTNMRNLLVGGQPRFLAWSSDEVSDAAEALRDAELTRATCYQALRDRHPGLPDTFDWDALLDLATDPQGALLRALRNDISTLAGELRGHLAACEDLGRRGLESTSAALAQLQGVDLAAALPKDTSIDPRRHLDQTL